MIVEQVMKIDFFIKENILLSLKQTKEEFRREVLFMSALMLYRKRKPAYNGFGGERFRSAR